MKITEKKILADDVIPILVLNLLYKRRAKHGIQAHDLDQSINPGPLQVVLPFLSTGGAEGFGGYEYWRDHGRHGGGLRVGCQTEPRVVEWRTADTAASTIIFPRL